MDCVGFLLLYGLISNYIILLCLIKKIFVRKRKKERERETILTKNTFQIGQLILIMKVLKLLSHGFSKMRKPLEDGSIENMYYTIQSGFK